MHILTLFFTTEVVRSQSSVFIPGISTCVPLGSALDGTLLIKSLGSVIFGLFLSENNRFNLQGCIELIKIVMLQHIFISNKCCSFQLFYSQNQYRNSADESHLIMNAISRSLS